MLLLKEENFITDPNALRTAALDLTYYSAIDHPEKNSDIEWASDNCSYSTIEISDTEGIIEDTVKQIASHIESSIKDVDDENGCINYVRGSHKKEGYRPHGKSEILGFSKGVTDFGTEAVSYTHLTLPTSDLV